MTEPPTPPGTRRVIRAARDLVLSARRLRPRPDDESSDDGSQDRGSPDHRFPDRRSPDHGSPDRGFPDEGTAERVHVERVRMLRIGAFTALSAVGFSLGSTLLVVVLAWAVSSGVGVSWAGAVRAGGWLWLLAHGGGIRVPDGSVSLTPLGLTAVVAAALYRAGRRAARQAGTTGDGSEAAAHHLSAAFLVVGLVLAYTACALVVAAAADTASVGLGEPDGACSVFVVALAAAGAGVLRDRGFSAVRARLPGWAGRVTRGAAGSLAAALGAGALVVAVALACHAGAFLGMTDRLTTDPGGVAGVLLLDVVLLPVAIVWAAAYGIGTGFAAGTGSLVWPGGAGYGALPNLPWLGLLPAPGAPGPEALAACLVPVAAGIAAGLSATRGWPSAAPSEVEPSAAPSDAEPSERAWLPPGRWTVAGRAALVGPCVGVAFALLALLADGSLGGGRLADLGPSPWLSGLVLGGETALVALATVAVVAARWAVRIRGERRSGEAATATIPAPP